MTYKSPLTEDNIPGLIHYEVDWDRYFYDRFCPVRGHYTVDAGPQAIITITRIETESGEPITVPEHECKALERTIQQHEEELANDPFAQCIE